MNSISKIRNVLKKNSFIREFVAFRLASSGLFDKIILNYKLSEYWKKRLELTLACSDNKKILRVPNAGKVHSGKQLMHNGLKIYLGSYYGPEIAKILLANKGVHEPQEERVFQEVIKKIKPGSTMLELGAFWSFYSAWFNTMVPEARNYMVEPDGFNLKCGQRNFKLNKLKGKFYKAFVGKSESNNSGIETIQVDSFLKKEKINNLAILHSDIQGYEYKMLQGAKENLSNFKIDFVFISTHNNKVHKSCKELLLNYKYNLIAESELKQSFSEDGLLVFSSPLVDFIPIQIDLKKY